MAFPINQITDISTIEGSPSANYNINLPTNVVAGDLLLVVCFARLSPTISTAATGWNALAQSAGVNTRMRAFWKKADGTESGTNIQINQTASTEYSAFAIRVTGAVDPTTQPPEVGYAYADVDEAAGNPPNLTPTGGAKNYLWIAAAGKRDSADVTSWDINYSNTGFISSTQAAVMGYMDRQLLASSEDPGTIGWTGIADWTACTIAVHPTGAAPAASPMPIFSRYYNSLLGG